MSAPAIVGLVLVGLLAAAAVGIVAYVVAVHLSTTGRNLRVMRGSDGTLHLRTPLGRATARLVVHEYQGRVYEVRMHFRRTGETVAYVPPAEHLVISLVSREVDAAQMGRSARQAARLTNTR